MVITFFNASKLETKLKDLAESVSTDWMGKAVCENAGAFALTSDAMINPSKTTGSVWTLRVGEV